MCHSKSRVQCLCRCLLILVPYLKTHCNQRAAAYWDWQTHFHAKVIQKSDHARRQRTADTWREPSQDQRADRGTEKERERCTAEEMRYQRYQFKERASALVIRDVTWVLCFCCGVKREFEERGLVCVLVRGGCVEGDQDICAVFEEVNHGTGTSLNPPSWACKRGFGPLLALHPHPQQ